MESFINARGNKVCHEPCGKDCYEIGMICRPERGWAKYHTEQDDYFFGIWTNGDQNQIIMLSGGEFSVIECDGDDAFQNEIDGLYALYGESVPKPEEDGRFEMNAIVSYNGRRGTIHNKTLQTDFGWVYQIHFDDQAEWVAEVDLVSV